MSAIINLDVSRYYDELFVLKRDFYVSNLPELSAIRTVSKANSDKKNKVAEIQLFNPEGEMYILEMWNRDATDGVKYLWDLLADEDEILLRIQDLDPNKPMKDHRQGAFKYHAPTSFQREFKKYPVKLRMYNKDAINEKFCQLSRQCTRIKVDHAIQLMNGKVPMRDFSQWHQTIERQEEDDDPDELQQLIYQSMASSPLGKRAGGGESSTQADKGNKVKGDPNKDLNEIAQKKFKSLTNATTGANRTPAANNNATKKGKNIPKRNSGEEDSEMTIKSENGDKMDIDDAEHV